MIVDDHALARTAIRRAFERADVEIVAEAASGEEAIPIALHARPDVLLIDIRMPGMSGIDVVRELAPRLPGSRMIMLTVSDARPDLFAAISAGAKGYLTKDMSPDALVRAVLGASGGDLAMPRRMAAAVVEELARPGSAQSRDARLDLLTARELDVLRLLAGGATDRDIGESLGISTRTVESHVAHVLQKLEARNRAAAATIYRGR